MTSFDEYVKGILKQILESYQTLLNLNDKPGNLEIIKTELLKTNGLFQVIVKKIELSKINSDEYVKLSKLSKHYLENYEFNREIDTMSNLYYDDPNRLKNIRLKIIDSLQDKKLMEIVEIIFKSK
jgi:hypothetical protein